MPGQWTQANSICSSRRATAYQQCSAWADHGSDECQQWADQGSWTCGRWADQGAYQCGQWADEGSYACQQWADQGSNQCSEWADQGSNQCSHWADEGSNQCCTWWPCSSACKAFYWVSNWVCQAWIWVANWVCLAWYWVANWVCQTWYWVANWVCKSWYWVAKWVCLSWYWVANWVCQGWYWVAKWVCIAWEWIVHVFCRGNGGPMFLLTDGTVLMNECANKYGTHRWWKLTPDANGSYLTGHWTRVADSHQGRKYFASAVLADGRLLVCGGEYSDASGSDSQDDTASTEIYDPVADAWTQISPPSGVSHIGDSACCLLPDGRFFLGNYNGTSTHKLDPASGQWTSAALKGYSASEESWVLMPDGTIVTPQCSNPPNAEKYLIASDQWMTAGTLAANLVETSSLEIGPGVLLPDGRAFFVGASGGVTALYQPGATPEWKAGPAIPRGSRHREQGSKDGPAALLPSGAVLFPVTPVDGASSDYLKPCSFFELDSSGTSLSRTSDPPTRRCPSYVGRLLLIPTGQVLWTREDRRRIHAYTEHGQPKNSFRPVVTTVPSFLVRGSTVAISGTQFNGLSQAVGYGDDYAAATNYPLVRIHSLVSGKVRYCRTSHHASSGGTSMGVATGALVVTTQVEIPGDLDPGPSELFVVANGIPSHAVKVMVQ